MTARQSPTVFRPNYRGGRWAQGQDNHSDVVDLVAIFGPCSAASIAVRLDLSRNTVLAHLRCAEQIGTVTHTGRGKSTRWSIQ